METQKNEMTTMTSVLENLRIKRQDNEFSMTEGGFKGTNGRVYTPDELTIIKTYRFEGESDPADNAIIYLIEACDGLIGYSMDTFGAYSNNEEGYDDFVKKIKVQDRDEQVLDS